MNVPPFSDQVVVMQSPFTDPDMRYVPAWSTPQEVDNIILVGNGVSRGNYRVRLLGYRDGDASRHNGKCDTWANQTC